MVVTMTSVTTTFVVGPNNNEDDPQLTIQGVRWQQVPSEKKATMIAMKHIRSFTNDDAIVHGATFAPGSLNMTLLESFRRCNVDSVSRRYKMHENMCTLMSYSSTYGLAYHLLTKSASSTIRGLMQDNFDGREGRVCSPRDPNSRNNLPKEHYDNLIHFTFFRDPLPRFVSGYTEFMVRYLRGKAGEVPRKYQQFLKTLDQHFRNTTLNINKKNGLKEIQKSDLYLKLYNTKEGLHVLAQVFDQFVQDYDAQNPFDTHLMLQIPRKLVFIGNSTGWHLSMDFAFYTEHGIQSQIEDILFPQIQKWQSNGIVELPNITAARNDNTRKEKTEIMLNFVSNTTKQKICQLTALDYCCLNYPLPVVCQNVVSCQWTTAAMPGSLPEKEGILSIQAVSPYPPVA
jgi:hypothetical protein